ncbi:MAG: bifunctional DNA-formamidopyrimidine glycosylase/DNA-(apurinic or apyrimidinic site) lyase [Candidatus Moranbacteria bacterium]|nr:bifunctional DNA-formamidopyrimidine glycosylase/DNA-(apurinic or apyrimidinic site) lyase [Candidatus Moranbacteria bacterium]
MPELPEVQTVVSDLNEKIKGDTIVDFWSEWPRAIKGQTLAVFKKEIAGRKILGARRIGKNIFIDLSGGKTLYLHLKMTGHLLVKIQNPKSKTKDYFADRVNQYIRHKFYLKADAKLRNIDESTNKKKIVAKNFVGSHRNDKVMEFSDMRKFAKIVLDDTDRIAQLPEIEALGLDAMDSEFTWQKFDEILDKKKNAPIGILLMDQSLIAGIGNIYRSEILFEAGILPTRKAADIAREERKKLFRSIGKILRKAVKLRGTSDSDYRDTAGAPGGYQKVLQVYRKAGEKCQRCDTIIKRAVLGQRSVFYCPGCQK